MFNMVLGDADFIGELVPDFMTPAIMIHELPAAAMPVVNAQVLVGAPNPAPPALPAPVSTRPHGRRYPPRQHQPPTLYSDSSFSALNSKLTWEEAIEKPNVVKAMDVELDDLQDGKKVQCVLTPEGPVRADSSACIHLGPHGLTS